MNAHHQPPRRHFNVSMMADQKFYVSKVLFVLFQNFWNIYWNMDRLSKKYCYGSRSTLLSAGGSAQCRHWLHF